MNQYQGTLTCTANSKGLCDYCREAPRTFAVPHPYGPFESAQEAAVHAAGMAQKVYGAHLIGVESRTITPWVSYGTPTYLKAALDAIEEKENA